MTARPSYYSIIPASVRYDTDLPAGAKLLYGEVTALCDKAGFCWATNAYFAALYETSNRTISRWLSALAKAGHIAYIVDDESGSSRKIWLGEAVISGMKKLRDPHDKNVVPPHDKNVAPPTTKMSRPPRQKCRDPHDKNVVQSNTVNITVSNTTTTEPPPTENHDSESTKKSPPSSARPPHAAFDLEAETEAMQGDPFAFEQFVRIGMKSDDFAASVSAFLSQIRAEAGADAEPNYPNRREFRRHFFNWVRRRVEAARPSVGGRASTPPRSGRASINRWENDRPALTEKQAF